MADIEKNSVETKNTNSEEAKKRPPRKKKTLKAKVCEILGINENRDINRPQGGVVKFYELGNFEAGFTVLYKGKTLAQFEYEKKLLIIAEKAKLREKLGEEYKKLTIDIRLFKPRFGAVKDKNKFSVGIYIYGPDFERIIKKIGKNKNVKVIQ